MISFDWEEGVFRGLRGTWQYLFHPKKTDIRQEGGVLLADQETQLEILARLVSGQPLRVRESELLGGLRGRILLLPKQIAICDDPAVNRHFFLIRTLIGAEMARQTGAIGEWDISMAGRIRYLFAVARSISSLAITFDRFACIYRDLFRLERGTRKDQTPKSKAARCFETLRISVLTDCLVDPVRWDEATQLELLGSSPVPDDLAPGFMLSGDVLTPQDAEKAGDAGDLQQDRNPGRGTEIESPAKDHIHRTFLEKVDEIDPLPMHTFEKTETADNYRGGSRQVDGDDELEEHLEALQDLDLREVIRGGRETKSIFRADIDLSGGIPDVHTILPEEKGIPYPEWNYAKKSYRPDWVTVYPTNVIKPNAPAAAKILQQRRLLIEELTNRLLAHRTRHNRLNRRNQGEEIDLDAVVEAYADRRAGRPPSEKLYSTIRKTREPTAVTLLLDVSLSSGSWVEGRRVIDVTRETVMVLGEVAEELGDLVRILCFAGNTRNHCRVFEVKSWRQPWSQARDLICGLEPQGYTRIGPAIRHAVAGFDDAPSSKRLLLLITDGKPTDYDRYEGIYGLEDVRMAIKEGTERGIYGFAIGLDARARSSLSAMFGLNAWQVLRHIGDLPECVVSAYGRLID
ncbi:VWA domain-containing protein [Sulfidibacter corallicola]|uniref:VWA domain-containing protein n=1 Tax=Sulfidibacter corallicola TaxID=2818388 RepID=A0A8A4TJF2_SULCO|nr:VWA domain-containing protein [Sulfidibacter corallicola]QTD50159.1 VWA domain-containing protein [Sulfidibacter corallicola]